MPKAATLRKKPGPKPGPRSGPKTATARKKPGPKPGTIRKKPGPKPGTTRKKPGPKPKPGSKPATAKNKPGPKPKKRPAIVEKKRDKPPPQFVMLEGELIKVVIRKRQSLYAKFVEAPWDPDYTGNPKRSQTIKRRGERSPDYYTKSSRKKRRKDKEDK